MVVKIKVIYEVDYVGIQNKANEFLAELSSSKVRDVKVDCDYHDGDDHYICTIIYEE